MQRTKDTTIRTQSAHRTHTIFTQSAHTNTETNKQRYMQHTEQNTEHSTENNTEHSTEHNAQNRTRHTEQNAQPQHRCITYDLHKYSFDLYNEYIAIKNSNTIELYTILK